VQTLANANHCVAHKAATAYKWLVELAVLELDGKPDSVSSVFSGIFHSCNKRLSTFFLFFYKMRFYRFLYFFQRFFLFKER